MHLYNLSLLPSSSITQACVGSFSSNSREQQIATVRGGTAIEMLMVDKSTGKLASLLRTNVFGTVRALMPFRLTGGTKGALPRSASCRCLERRADYLIVGSDSGRIVVLEYDAENNVLVKLHQETFGKSGSRRIVPGQYLAVDPKGRSVMLGAMEKSKLCVRCAYPSGRES